MTESRGQVVRAGRPAAPPLRAAMAVAALLGLVVAGALWLGHFADENAAGADAAGLRLEVWDHEAQQAVYHRAAAVGETFQLRHTHSVTRRPVIERFSVTGAEGIAIEELWFDEFGPNLPAGPERIGDTTTTFLTERGGYRVIHHGRLLPTVPIRVGSAGVNHVATFADGTRLRLLDVTRPAAFVELRIAS